MCLESKAQEVLSPHGNEESTHKHNGKETFHIAYPTFQHPAKTLNLPVFSA
ncbi:uncharacterized protein METZ01_LOCUS440975, partial [marine metagenome]